jgi:flagellar protein FliS
LAYSNALSTYKETKIKTAGQGQLIIMLYEEAVKQLTRALEMMDSNKQKKDPGKIEQISKSVMKTEEIITELMVSLDFERGGEISKNLFALYSWFNRELLEANIAQDTGRITAVKNMLADLKDTWGQIVIQQPGEPGNRENAGINIAG